MRYKDFVRKLEGKPNPEVMHRWPFCDSLVGEQRRIAEDIRLALTNPKYLNDAFFWERTPQGHKYWYRVYLDGFNPQAKDILKGWLKDYESGQV